MNKIAICICFGINDNFQQVFMSDIDWIIPCPMSVNEKWQMVIRSHYEEGFHNQIVNCFLQISVLSISLSVMGPDSPYVLQDMGWCAVTVTDQMS